MKLERRLLVRKRRPSLIQIEHLAGGIRVVALLNLPMF